MDKIFLDKLEELFNVDIENKELETWTDKGYNIILYVESWSKEDVLNVIKLFDASHEVQIWWDDELFRNNYNNSMREALDDMEEWQKSTLEAIESAFCPTESNQVSCTLNVDDILNYVKMKNILYSMAELYFKKHIKHREEMEFLNVEFHEVVAISYSELYYDGKRECNTEFIPFEDFLKRIE